MQRHLGAGRAADPHPDPADEVLAEVHQRAASRGGPGADGRQLGLPADGRPDVGGEGPEVELGLRDAGPALAGEPRLQPRVGRPPGVDGLTVVEVVGQHGRGPGRPGLVGHHPLDVAVGEGDLQLDEGPELGAVVVAAAVPAQPSPEPAVAQGEPQHRRGRQQRGHVVAAVAQPPLVGAPAGAQHVVGHRLAVEERFEDAVRGRVQVGRGDVAVAGLQLELATEERCPLEVRVGHDEGGRPAGHDTPRGRTGRLEPRYETI